MKKSLIAYFFVFAFILSSCSSQKVATSSSNSTYPSTSGHKKFTPGQENQTGESARLEDLKSRMAVLEAQLDAIKSGESSKSKKATEKEVAAVSKEIEKVKKEEIAANSPKKGQKKFVPKTKSKEEIAAAKAKAKKPAKTKESPVDKTKVAANTSKPKDTKKPVKKPTEKTKPKTDTKTASASPKKPTAKPKKPAAPPKPKIVYKTISEKVLGNYFMDGSTSSQNMFCLHKTAPVGTQVKVINPMNGKSLTLKVLGKIPNLAEDMGVAIKITYSAARQLNLRDQRFELKCSYKMPFKVDPITGASASVR